jgi:hypothetical protein
MNLDKDDLIPFAKRRVVEAQWCGKKVWIQSLTEGERAQLEAAVLEDKGASLRASVIVQTLVDESGRRLFSDDAVDLAFVQSLDSRVTSEIYEQVDAHCGQTGKGSQEELEAAAKN